MMCLVFPQVRRFCTGIWVTNRSPPSQKSRPVTHCPTGPQANGNSSEGSTTSAAASVSSMQTYTTAPPYPIRKQWHGSLQRNLPRDHPQNPHCSAAGSPDSSCSRTECHWLPAIRVQYYHLKSGMFHRIWDQDFWKFSSASIKDILGVTPVTLFKVSLTVKTTENFIPLINQVFKRIFTWNCVISYLICAYIVYYRYWSKLFFTC